MLPLSVAAESDLNALTSHFAKLGRYDAIERLVTCVEMACARLESGQGLFYAAPRPYPALANFGFRWTKEGPYWIAFADTDAGSVIAGVFYAAANILIRI